MAMAAPTVWQNQAAAEVWCGLLDGALTPSRHGAGTLPAPCYSGEKAKPHRNFRIIIGSIVELLTFRKGTLYCRRRRREVKGNDTLRFHGQSPNPGRGKGGEGEAERRHFPCLSL